MTVLSLLLTGQPLTTKIRQDTIDPTLDLALYSYLTRCTATYAALRCILVSVELLRYRGGGAADDAARWAIRALEMNALGTIGHALVTERVSACYAVRKGVGSGGWGARRRKTAMWKILAAKGWMDLGKRGRARGCLEEAVPVYEGVGWRGIGDMLGWLKEQSGFVEKDGRGKRVSGDSGGFGVGDGDDDEGLIMMGGGSTENAIGRELEGEMLDLGGEIRVIHHKRGKSADGGVLGVGLSGHMVDERINDDDEFVDS